MQRKEGTVKLPHLRAIREKKLLTREELAALAGLSYQGIVRLELGGSARITTVRKLASALEVDAVELIGEDQAPGQQVAA